MDYIQPFLNIALGGMIVICFILIKTVNSLTIKLNKYKNNKLSTDDINELKDKISILEVQKVDIEKENDKLRRYIGAVNEKELGILEYTLVKTDHTTEEKKQLDCEFEFKVVKRGQNKVKIEIIDYKVENENRSEALLKRCKSIVEGWYDIDDKRITWVEPDKAVMRDFNIDEVLGD